MFAQIIELKNKEDTSCNVTDLIEFYISSLRNNGQILLEYQLVKRNSGYSIYVTTPKADSLEERFDSKYVKQYRQELDKYFTVTVTQMGLNAYSQEYCSCTARTTVEMQTYFSDIDSCLTCCTCGKPIALYELPHFDGQDDHYHIVGWQNVYKSAHKLWLDSLSDRFTGNQLVNVNSVLNRQGRKIANEISSKTGYKVYYNIFDDLTNKVKFVKVNDRHIRLCPCCGKQMQYVKFCKDYEKYVCEDCSLSSDLPNEE